MATGRSMAQSGTTKTTPRCFGDFVESRDLMPAGGKLDDAQFLAPTTVHVVVGAAGAAATTTSVPVGALSAAIPSGITLSFGTDKFARLTAAAALGATTLTVAALPTALVDADAADYVPSPIKHIPTGTPIGRTIAERDAGTGYGPAVNTDDEVFLVAYDVDDAAKINDVELLRPFTGFVVKENYLPGWATVAAALKLVIRARYNCTRGQE